MLGLGGGWVGGFSKERENVLILILKRGCICQGLLTDAIKNIGLVSIMYQSLMPWLGFVFLLCLCQRLVLSTTSTHGAEVPSEIRVSSETLWTGACIHNIWIEAVFISFKREKINSNERAIEPVNILNNQTRIFTYLIPSS